MPALNDNVQIEDVDPRTLVRWDRFDVFIKIAYARHVLNHGLADSGYIRPVPFAAAAYLEHIHVWRLFNSEPCVSRSNGTTDPNIHPNCTKKDSAADFIESFHSLLLSLRRVGFVRSRSSAIPVCEKPNAADVATDAPPQYLIRNGAHRVAAAVALGLPTVPIVKSGVCEKGLLPPFKLHDFMFFLGEKRRKHLP